MAAWTRLSPVLLLAACVRTTPQPPSSPPPPPPVVVPAGCTASLEGPWRHAEDPSFRYEAQDDGGTLTLVVFRELVVDAGFVPRRFRPLPDAGVDAGTALDGGAADAGGPAADAGFVTVGDLDGGAPLSSSVRIELARTASGFVGSTIAPLQHPSGRWCEVRFPTRVLTCADGGLVLETSNATALGDTCQPPARPLEQLTTQHPLVRLPARPDAG